MKVLLLEEIKNLGKKGEIVEVKDGYGQNFLIAKGKAQLATNEVINRYKAQERNRQEELALQDAHREALAKTLHDLTLKITKKSGESGSLFGAVTKDEISAALHTLHRLEIDKKHIELNEQIKHTGEYKISANLGDGVHASFTLIVEGE